MTKQTARDITERLGINVDMEAEFSTEEIVAMASRINYGDGHLTDEELTNLALAIETLRA